MQRSTLTLILLFIAGNSLAQIDFTPWINFEVEAYAEYVCVGDVNNDGLEDVVLGGASHDDPGADYIIFVFTQNLQGNLDIPTEYHYEDGSPGIRSLDIADVNNDGLNDVIIGYGLGLGIFYQNINGTLDTLQNYSVGSDGKGTACGDLNNDGLIDIAVTTSWSGDFIHVFYQTETGFTTTVINKPYTPGGVLGIALIEDVNGDDLKDLILKNSWSKGVLYLYMQNNLGVLDDAVEYPYTSEKSGSIWDVAAGDLNNDNRNDLVTSIPNNENKRNVLWFQDTITNTLTIPPLEISAYSGAEAIAIFDLNCDDRNEIIVAHNQYQKITVYEQDSLGNYNNYQEFHTPYESHYYHDGFDIGDINNDGTNDIAVANTNKGLVLHYNKSTPTYFEIDSTYTFEDTINVNDQLITSNYITTYVYNNNGYSITQIDSFIINNLFREYNIRYDTVIIKTGEICLEQHFDTTVIINYHTNITLIYTDTLFISTSKDSVNLVKEINIYPNPTMGIVHIDLPSPYDEMDLQISIYDNWGRNVRKEVNTQKGNKRILEIEEFAFGNYFIHIATKEEELLIKKIIKTK